MKTRIFIVGIFSVIGLLPVVSAQSLKLQGISTVNCGTASFCMTLQVRAVDANPVKIGSSSILITYNPAALSYTTYTPLEFDGTDVCNAGTPAWALPTHAATSGKISLTMILKEGQSANSCPTITNGAWIDIGTVCFSIVSNSIFPNIKIDPLYTHFNKNLPNDGSAMIPVTQYDVYSETCGTDTDNDGVANAHDNCVSVVNPLQGDSDKDGIGDACDPQCNFPVLGSPNLTVCQGSAVTLAALIEAGVPPYSYIWNTGATTSSIQVNANSNQTYQVTVTDAASCVGTDNVNVNVSVSAITSIAIYDLDNGVVFETIEEGDVFNYSTLPVNFNIKATASGDQSSIKFVLAGAQYYQDYENTEPYHFPGDFDEFEAITGQYTLTATLYRSNNLVGITCDERVLHFSIINDCAKIDLPDVLPLCLGETVTINSNVEGTHGDYLISWSNGMFGDSITLAPTETNFLFVTVTDESNCVTEGGLEVHVTSADIVTLLLWNLSNGTVYDTIRGGEIYNIDDLPNNYNIRAIPISGNTESIAFDLYADFGVWGHTENSAPYEFPGGNIDFWQDNFTMVVSAWDEDWRGGYSCGSYSFSFQMAYLEPGCNVVTNTNDSGVGSLPHALNCAQWWETVFFDPSVHHDTIVLNTNYALFSTGSSLSALPEHEIYIKGAGTQYALKILPDLDPWIDGVNIIAGTAAQGAAIYNEGNITLENVTIHPHAGGPTTNAVLNMGTINMRGAVEVKKN